jgi:aryl-alcohol dehydrogenase-like predicted oxidoreductase
LLSGKYGRQRRPEAGRLMENKMYQTRYGDEQVYAVAEEFSDFARANGYEPAALAVAWVRSHPGITAPIIGSRNLAQLDGSLKSIDIEMTPDLREEISAISPAPPPATDRNEERTVHSYKPR